MRGTQVLQDVVDEGAAVGVQVVLAQQHVEAVLRRLAAVARILDRIDRVKVARQPDGMEHAAHVVPRRIREDQLHAAQARQGMLEGVLVHHDVGQLGEHVRLGEEAPRVGAVMAHQAVQRGAVAQPEVAPHAIRALVVHAELALEEIVDLQVHRRKDGRGRVVQRVVEVKNPHPPRRRQAGNAHYLLLMRVPTPWSVSTSSSSALGTPPSMMCTLRTPLRAASSAEPILGSMPPEITPLASTPGVLVSTTSFSACSTSASLPATRSALML